MRGEPFAVRLTSGLTKPRDNYVPEFDVAGIVEAVGEKVTQFQPDDEVLGECNGTCAEYACCAADKFVAKPANLTFEQAAAVPVSALVALHGLRDAGKVTPVIDRTYRLSETAEAMAYVGEGHARGKVVITVAGDAD